MYNHQRLEMNRHSLLMALRYCNERPKKNRHQGYRLLGYTKQSGTNEQREGKECETRRQEVENTKTKECEKNYEIGLEES